MNCENLKPGDRVIRMLGGSVPMPMQVKEIREGVVHCAAVHPNKDGTEGIVDCDWRFDVATGAEIDDDLRWGPEHGRSGSFLTELVS